jgi:hypothetical protein
MGDQELATILKLDPATLTDPDVSPEVWIDRYARLHGIEYHYKTNAVRQDGEALESGIFISKMRLFTHNADLGGIKKMLMDGFIVWRREQARKYVLCIRTQFTFNSTGTDWVSEWVEAATGKRDPIDVAVTKHFIWQVKRKLFGLKVDHHLMLVCFGKSGGGKSEAVHRLLSPLSDVTSLRDMTIFNDSFAKRAFNRNYIMFFDELGRSQDADVNALKNIITAPTIDWRGLGSETVHSAAQNSTFIGCTNAPVRERIQDPTSSRRFFQLNCADKLDWEMINFIDYQELWQSIDENRPSPILDCLDEVRAIQESEIKQQDNIECWLQNSCEPFEFNADSPNTDALYSSFSEWARNQTMFNHEGLQTFARGLQLRIFQLKWDASSKRSNRGTIWSLRLKPSIEESPRRPMGLHASFNSEAVSAPTEIINDPGEKT